MWAFAPLGARFQVNIDLIGRPIESIQFEQVGKWKSVRKEELFLKSFFFLVPGFGIID